MTQIKLKNIQLHVKNFDQNWSKTKIKIWNDKINTENIWKHSNILVEARLILGRSKRHRKQINVIMSN